MKRGFVGRNDIKIPDTSLHMGDGMPPRLVRGKGYNSRTSDAWCAETMIPAATSVQIVPGRKQMDPSKGFIAEQRYRSEPFLKRSKLYERCASSASIGDSKLKSRGVRAQRNMQG